MKGKGLAVVPSLIAHAVQRNGVVTFHRLASIHRIIRGVEIVVIPLYTVVCLVYRMVQDGIKLAARSKSQ